MHQLETCPEVLEHANAFAVWQQGVHDVCYQTLLLESGMTHNTYACATCQAADVSCVSPLMLTRTAAPEHDNQAGMQSAAHKLL